MLKTKIKASAITNLTDARYFAAKEIEWLGFNISTNGYNAMRIEDVAAIIEWVEGVKIIAEVDSIEPDSMADFLRLPFQGVQYGMFTPMDWIANLPENTIKIQEYVVASKEDIVNANEWMASRKNYTNYFLLDFQKNNLTFQDFGPQSIGFIQELCKGYAIIMNIALDENNIIPILDTFSPAGLNVMGGIEEKVGLKSFDDLEDIFDAIEVLL